MTFVISNAQKKPAVFYPNDNNERWLLESINGLILSVYSYCTIINRLLFVYLFSFHYKLCFDLLNIIILFIILKYSQIIGNSFSQSQLILTTSCTNVLFYGVIWSDFFHVNPMCLKYDSCSAGWNYRSVLNRQDYAGKRPITILGCSFRWMHQ